jgi:hypothetical protein
LIEALQEAKANPTIHTSQFIDEIERQLLDWDKDAREGSGGVFSDGIILNNRK